MKRIMIPALAGSALVFAGAANAQQPDFSKVEMKTTDLGNRTYMLEGQGGNIVVACRPRCGNPGGYRIRAAAR